MSGVEGMPLYLIMFDDTEIPVETMFGEEVARKRFEQVSQNWNAHLFVKLESNSRDDLHAKSNHVCANPAAVLELIAERERNKRMLLDACMEMGAIGSALDADMNADGEQLLSMVVDLKAENEALRKDRTDWQAECLKRGFEYVREPDDHYVLADVPEMADLLGALLGVEVRSKENDAYDEANSQLNEEIEGLINTIHSQESLHKDAERYRWLRDPDHCAEDFIDGPVDNIVVGSAGGEDILWLEDLDAAIDSAMVKEGVDD